MSPEPRTPPYLPFLDGTAEFAPNLKPITADQWLTPDTEAQSWLNEKCILMKLQRREVCAGELNSDAAQDVLHKVMVATGETPLQEMPAALEEAASLVSDDICLLQAYSRGGFWSGLTGRYKPEMRGIRRSARALRALG